MVVQLQQHEHLDVQPLRRLIGGMWGVPDIEDKYGELGKIKPKGFLRLYGFTMGILPQRKPIVNPWYQLLNFPTNFALMLP